jgi:hypothetical protein
MAGKLPMGQKELLRGKLMEMVEQGKKTLKTAEDIRNRVIEQYRLVKELRMAGISTIEQANRFLLETYLPREFARSATDSTDALAPLLDVNLTDIFCFECDRTVSNDYTVRFETRLFQLLKEQGVRPLPKKPVTVRRNLDGTLCILRDTIPLKFIKILSKKEANPSVSDAA